jgi:hypothetical protein
VLWGVLFIGFLDRIVEIESKDSNDFLVQIQLYLAKIWKKSKRGQNRFLSRLGWVGLGRLRQNSYPQSGRVRSGWVRGRVRLGWVRGRVGWVRESGEAGLGRVRQNP